MPRRIPKPEPEFVETLNDLLIEESVADWTDDHIKRIIEGFRAQRVRWNEEQAVGSRKRVTSAKIKTPKKKPSETQLDLLNNPA